MKNAHDIANALGQRRLAEALGIGVTAVSNAAVRQKFPAAWYPVVLTECEAEGIDCPLSAFNFKSPTSRPSAEAS